MSKFINGFSIFYKVLISSLVKPVIFETMLISIFSVNINFAISIFPSLFPSLFPSFFPSSLPSI